MILKTEDRISVTLQREKIFENGFSKYQKTAKQIKFITEQMSTLQNRRYVYSKKPLFKGVYENA